MIVGQEGHVELVGFATEATLHTNELIVKENVF